MAMPFKIKFAGTIGSVGVLIACTMTSFFGVTLYRLALATILGWTVGFLIGYRLSVLLNQAETIARAEGVISSSEKLDVVLGWTFSIACIVSLALGGWNLWLVIGAIFFSICSLYLTYRR